jgi:hypothetical protein
MQKINMFQRIIITDVRPLDKAHLPVPNGQDTVELTNTSTFQAGLHAL